jgi:citrate/tricarballylate utilization protein
MIQRPETQSMLEGHDARLAEADRQLTICNACRYCEDYCAVFPAAELRESFLEGDVDYLANLCHDCRACYQACMYTEPHDFAINIPALLAEARIDSYERNSRPRWLRAAFDAGPLALAALTLAVLAGFLGLYAIFAEVDSLFEQRSGEGSFYEVVSHAAMAVPALLLTGFIAVVAGVGLLAFWRGTGARRRDLLDLGAWRVALAETGTMKWMQGSGDDCYYPSEALPSPVRRRMHHLVMYGFLATFAATVAAFVAEYLFDRMPPYPVLSVPVLLGLGGGVAVVAGALGLLVLKGRSARHLAGEQAIDLDLAFLVSLISVSISGLALLVLRDSSAMGATLIIHLATVAVLYLTAPYGKFVHAVYRLAALVRNAQERRAIAR